MMGYALVERKEIERAMGKARRAVDERLEHWRSLEYAEACCWLNESVRRRRKAASHLKLGNSDFDRFEDGRYGGVGSDELRLVYRKLSSKDWRGVLIERLDQFRDEVFTSTRILLQYGLDNEPILCSAELLLRLDKLIRVSEIPDEAYVIGTPPFSDYYSLKPTPSSYPSSA